MMKKIGKVFGFIGFLVSVWIVGGRSAEAGFYFLSKDVATNSKTNVLKSLDAPRFARIGELQKIKKENNLFAYACLGFASNPGWNNKNYHADTTYFYACKSYGSGFAYCAGDEACPVR